LRESLYVDYQLRSNYAFLNIAAQTWRQDGIKCADAVHAHVGDCEVGAAVLIWALCEGEGGSASVCVCVCVRMGVGVCVGGVDGVRKQDSM
jgi:hypothetical protein